jgi:hypothetical protein
VARTGLRRTRRLVTFGAIFASLAFGGRPKAAEPEEAEEPAPSPSPSPSEEVPPPRATKPAPPAADEAPPEEAPSKQPPVAVIEHMSPETFPGRLRGLYGGSLWLEPDFQGLQWPQNSRTGLGISAKLWVDSGGEVIKRGSDQIPNSSFPFMQGRGLFRLTPAYVSGRFLFKAEVDLAISVSPRAPSA